MARTARLDHPGAWHHVTARGNERHAIYRDDGDRVHFCRLLGETIAVFAWRLHAYVLMENHFHLLVETPEANLSRGMQWLNVSYSVWFNRRYHRVGHLLQGRFKSVVVDPTGWGLELSRYIHLNPVRVSQLGLDKSARQRDGVGTSEKPSATEVKARLTRLRSYRWSSYRAYAGFTEAPQWLRRERILELGGARMETAREAYRQYVESAIRQGLQESPWENLQARTILGAADFARQIVRNIGLTMENRAGNTRALVNRPTVAQIIAAVERVKGEKWDAFRDRHRDWGRDLVFYLGRKDWGLKLRELGEAAGGVSEMVVSVAAKRLPQKAQANPDLAAALKESRRRLEMSNV